MEEKRYLLDVRVARIEHNIDEIKKKLETIFQLMNEQIMPRVHIVPMLSKGFWLMFGAVLSIAAWLLKDAIAK